eukprot:CAMPEP_0117490852 /NCGR_PEP_ID=MMETSP0784-20121206/17761_1 /TAXON_ID=39447 /ORGANISM="" /LENGTH=664 /DNA_ID=CAMNT_0005285617 /DNA_START=52 /DNA_END=2046 /DNA_ORIENTATION=+
MTLPNAATAAAPASATMEGADKHNGSDSEEKTSCAVTDPPSQKPQLETEGAKDVKGAPSSQTEIIAAVQGPWETSRLGPLVVEGEFAKYDLVQSSQPGLRLTVEEADGCLVLGGLWRAAVPKEGAQLLTWTRRDDETGDDVIVWVRPRGGNSTTAVAMVSEGQAPEASLVPVPADRLAAVQGQWQTSRFGPLFVAGAIAKYTLKSLRGRGIELMCAADGRLAIQTWRADELNSKCLRWTRCDDPTANDTIVWVRPPQHTDVAPAAATPKGVPRSKFSVKSKPRDSGGDRTATPVRTRPSRLHEPPRRLQLALATAGIWENRSKGKARRARARASKADAPRRANKTPSKSDADDSSDALPAGAPEATVAETSRLQELRDAVRAKEAELRRLQQETRKPPAKGKNKDEVVKNMDKKDEVVVHKELRRVTSKRPEKRSRSVNESEAEPRPIQEKIVKKSKQKAVQAEAPQGSQQPEAPQGPQQQERRRREKRPQPPQEQEPQQEQPQGEHRQQKEQQAQQAQQPQQQEQQFQQQFQQEQQQEQQQKQEQTEREQELPQQEHELQRQQLEQEEPPNQKAQFKRFTKEVKMQLQEKLDALDDDQLERVLAFLEPDIGSGADEEVQLDVDNLSAERQWALLKMVDAELAGTAAKEKLAETACTAPLPAAV